MEMEMRAVEDVPIGRDLTPPFFPLASVLRDSAISTHCSACFHPLPPQPFPALTPSFPNNPQDALLNSTPSVLYCSLHCSSLDSPVHLSSSEVHLLGQSLPSTWNDSAELRLCLRLLYLFRELNVIASEHVALHKISGPDTKRGRLMPGQIEEKPLSENGKNRGSGENLESRNETNINTEDCGRIEGVLERILGLMTNHERLVFGGSGNGNWADPDKNIKDYGDRIQNDDLLDTIKDGVKAVTLARRITESVHLGAELGEEEWELAEMVLCLVLTNAVEVEDKNGRSIGVAVYGASFSWINHSCSPNASYRFVMSPDNYGETKLRISPAGMYNYGFKGNENEGIIDERKRYGPRVIVRSLKAVNKGEEATIAYTDLLQPKETRKSELWLKYRFDCGCKRCSQMPATYVDHALQDISAVSLSYIESEKDIGRLTEQFDDVLDEYLSFNNPEAFCMKLEHLLIHGPFDEQPETKEVESKQNLKLNPTHYLSLNAYTTLSSAYKVRASDLLAFDSGIDKKKLDAFNMYKMSAAYSLLLAGAAHHLFTFESSLVTSVANFWLNAGESLLNVARSSLWNLFLKLSPSSSEFQSLLTHKCDCCSLADGLEANFFGSEDQNKQLKDITEQFFNCIANIMPEIWRFLVSGSGYLKMIENPIDFRWFESMASCSFSDSETSLAMKRNVLRDEPVECTSEHRRCLTRISIHCIRYGAFLSSLCYGLHSLLTCNVTEMLSHVGI